ncbi:MAG: hypothetical protein LBC57_03940 [Treponema sp.]|jgi:hypothetical protein|nr:hypothetical protein [Treponema sp.]
MKKIILTAIMIAALGAAAFARDKAPAMEQKTLSGTLVVEYGQIALKAEDGLYYVRGLGQLAGFVDGLKEGAAVTLQGTVWAPERKHRNTRPETEGQKAEIAPRTGDSQGSFRVIRAEKLSLNGKDYDLLLTEGRREDRGFNPWSKTFDHGPDRYMHRRPEAAPYHWFPNTRGLQGHMNGMHGSREWRERRMPPRQR